MRVLVLGGARSGKTHYAQQLAQASQKTVYYIATAQARDAEMTQRIALHQQSRPAHWQTLEEPIALANILRRYDSEAHCLLVDCLTLWLCNILYDADGELQETRFTQQVTELLETVTAVKSELILVSNEIGLGVVPLEKMTRRFVDEAGLLHQQLAQRCERVIFVSAGLGQVLK